MKRKINFNAFAGDIAGERFHLNTRVYGCEEESSHYCRLFLFPITPRVLTASEECYADICNRRGI